MKPESSKTTQLEHGVFVAMYGLGMLIRGPAGIGKSSLALELIDRGHAFVSDDVVQFRSMPSITASESTIIVGSAPPMLQNLLAVRDIGVLDISELYESKTILCNHILDFIIQLTPHAHPTAQNITNPYNESLILDHKFPNQQIFAHASRNLALIVETALKNYILYNNGQDAGHTLTARQQQYL